MSEQHVSHVFLSYSEENEGFVESLAERLRKEAGLASFLDI